MLCVKMSSKMLGVFVFLLLFWCSTNFQGCFSDTQRSQKQKGSSNVKNGGSLPSTVVFRVSGNVYPSGYFYTTLKIGEPPKPYDLDIDTGSDLTWVHCDAPCVNCPKSPHQPYKPRNNALTCKDSMCTVLQHPPNYPCRNPSDQCDYEIEYADHGSSFGVVVKDNFSFEYLNGSIGRPFLIFGSYYTIGPAEVLFNGQNAMKTSFSFVLDSGSTYTYLSGELYKAVISLIKKNIDLKKLKLAPEDKTLPLCWKGSKPFKSINDIQKLFMPLTLRFSKTKNAMMEVPPEAYLILTKSGNACLGILDGSVAELGNLNVLGDVSLLNKVVIYDNEKNQIGWITANCDKIPMHSSEREGGYDEL